jgi:hypothetical protein
MHPNIQPFYGFASDQAFSPFGALVSPVRWLFIETSSNIPSHLLQWCLNGDATHYLAQNGERMVMAERINLVGNEYNILSASIK